MKDRLQSRSSIRFSPNNPKDETWSACQLQDLVRYWGTYYDWRKAEAKLNALPQFMTNIDVVDIHFIHVRSKNPNALPVLITHGWPEILETEGIRIRLSAKCISLAKHDGRIAK